MITDEELLLYHYRELDADERASIGAALGGQPELAQRLHKLVTRLDAAAVSPEVPVPAEFEKRWHAALESAATSVRAAPVKRGNFSRPRWQALAAAAALAAVAFVVIVRMSPPSPPQFAEVEAQPRASGAEEATAYEHGLKRHLVSTERQLASLEAATPEERARLVAAIIGQNRIYALAAERAGEPQLARVLRAFTPILEEAASGRGEASAGSIAQLGFELRIMQARLDAAALPTNSL